MQTFMASKGNPEQYLSIHYLRGLAALMVVAVHCFTYGLVPVAQLSSVLWLKHGVALFFVISGFVMVTSTQGRRTDPRNFLLRRLVRIAPLYWAMTLAWSMVQQGWDGRQLAASLAFVPSLDPASGSVRSPVLEPGWTLNFEMFFYVIFALGLFLPERFRFWSVAAALVLITQAGTVIDLPPLAAFYTDGLLLLFVVGMAIARFDLRLPALWMAPAFIALILFSDSLPIWQGVFVPVTVIVLAARSLDGRLPRWRLPAMLGDASYSLYLSHLFVLQFGKIFIAPYLPGPLVFALMIAGACVLALLVYRTVEVPASAWGRSRLTHRTKVAVEQAPEPGPVPS